MIDVNGIELLIDVEAEERRRKAERMDNYESQRSYYQTNPLEYFKDRLAINPEMIDWSRISAYENHRWDGTENPLMKILDALVAGKWCGVESATSTGKTFLGALIVFWFLENFENSLVVTSAPKQDQLTLHIWREISKLYSRFNKGNLTTLKLRMQEDSEDWLAIGFTAGVKADEESSTKAQGFHAEHLLILIEETPGVPWAIATAFMNTATSPHNLILAMGNPDNQQDNLHKFCKIERVEHVRISGYDHPNVVLNNPNFIPGAMSWQGLRDMLARYGDENNPLYLSRARGISPEQSADALIRWEWFKRATDRFLSLCDEKGKLITEKFEGQRCLGVDVANSESGDKAAIAEGVGRVLIKVEDFHCPDSNQLGKRDVYTRMIENKIKPSCVGVDGVGVGAGTVNGLKELGLIVKNLMGSDKARSHKGEEEFKNLRSQMWWQLREDLRNDLIDLPVDQELFEDLASPNWFTQNGKIVVESKEDFKKRLGRSPNKGDAVVYWNWVRTTRSAGVEILK